MSKNTHKSAAVPFVNQKGERSMKRVKVERYVAGKKPTYANDDDEEEYTTDDEQDYDDDEEYDDNSSDISEEQEHKVDIHKAGSSKAQDDRKLGSNDRLSPAYARSDAKSDSNSGADQVSEDDDDDDDPRLRRLRQIGSKSNVASLIEVQRTHQIQPKYGFSDKNVVLDEDDDEEEIRKRHSIARQRQLEEPLGLQAIISIDQQFDPANEDNDHTVEKLEKRLDTEDFLKDIKLTRTKDSSRSDEDDDEAAAEQKRLRESLEQARLEAAFISETNRKADEDIKRELEKEALAKGDIGAKEMTSVSTDDEDEELAYEEWKLREIKRIQRDRAERILLIKG